MKPAPFDYYAPTSVEEAVDKLAGLGYSGKVLAGGQSLIPACLEKAGRLKQLRQDHDADFLIAVDGGINEETAALARDAGVDVMISGSAFFKAADKAAYVRALRGSMHG